MSHPRIAIMLPALLAGCALGPSPTAMPGPGCRATLVGGTMTTVIDFPSGFRLEGHWLVLGLGPPDGTVGDGRMVADLLLDNLAQADSANDAPTFLPLNTSLRLRAVGENATEALQQVADTWCNSILDATRRGIRFDRLIHATPGRVT